MKKLIPILALCFCIAQNTFAQDQQSSFGNTSDIDMMHNAPIDMIDQSGRFLGQTFTLETTSFVESISLAVFEVYSLYGHTGTLTFYDGEAFGEVLWTSQVEYPGLSMFLDNPVVFEGVSASTFSSYWNNLVFSPVTITGDKSFEDVKVTFPINRFFEPGMITVVMELDNYLSIDRSPCLVTFINCSFLDCLNSVDPYIGGSLLTDNVPNFFINENDYTPMMDMAFEVKIRPELSTGVSQPSSFSELRLPIRDGVLTIPDAFAGWHLLITDLISRELVAVPSLVGGQSVSIESMINQVVIVSFLSKEGERKTAKILVR